MNASILKIAGVLTLWLKAVTKMEHYKKLGYNFYTLDLYYGKTHFRPGRNIMCFFIVEHPCTEDFIHDQALQLLMTPCRNFYFYGAYSKQWNIAFDWIDHALHPNDEDTDISMTNQWDELEQFVDALHHALSMRPLVPCDIFLIYDDINLYRTVLEKLLKYDNIRRYHSDWWELIYRLQ